MKYTNIETTFREVPDEVSLCINISNCPIHCKDCHSKFLWEDIGDVLTKENIEQWLGMKKYSSITCVCFMGGDAEKEYVKTLASFVKSKGYKTCWYSGTIISTDEIFLFGEYFDFIKTGQCIEKFGPLNNKTTNQRFYSISGKTITDITEKFWK